MIVIRNTDQPGVIGDDRHDSRPARRQHRELRARPRRRQRRRRRHRRRDRGDSGGGARRDPQSEGRREARIVRVLRMRPASACERAAGGYGARAATVGQIHKLDRRPLRCPRLGIARRLLAFCASRTRPSRSSESRSAAPARRPTSAAIPASVTAAERQRGDGRRRWRDRERTASTHTGVGSGADARRNGTDCATARCSQVPGAHARLKPRRLAPEYRSLSCGRLTSRDAAGRDRVARRTAATAASRRASVASRPGARNRRRWISSSSRNTRLS